MAKPRGDASVLHKFATMLLPHNSSEHMVGKNEMSKEGETSRKTKKLHWISHGNQNLSSSKLQHKTEMPILSQIFFFSRSLCFSLFNQLPLYSIIHYSSLIQDFKLKTTFPTPRCQLWLESARCIELRCPIRWATWVKHKQRANNQI